MCNFTLGKPGTRFNYTERNNNSNIYTVENLNINTKGKHQFNFQS